LTCIALDRLRRLQAEEAVDGADVSAGLDQGRFIG
jgi:hypothetical protein